MFVNAASMRSVALLLPLAIGVLPDTAIADDRSAVLAGHAIAQANCARCHNIESSGESPFTAAPPFRIVARIYKTSDLEEAFAEGIVVGHPAMPEFKMTAEQAMALAAFIDSLGH